MQKLLMVGWIGAFACAFFCYPVAGIIGSGAVEAYVIVPKDPETVKLEKELFDPPRGKSKDSPEYRNAVMRIYGVPTDEPVKVVFVPAEKFITPSELPTVKLLPKEKNWTQLKTIYWFAPRVMLGAAVVGFLLVIAWIILRRKSLKAPPPPPAQPA
jgi:hypothetical protein